MPLEEHVRAGRLQLSWAAPMERLLDDIADEILGTVDATGARRVVIDGVDALRLAAVYPDRVPRFVAALMFELRARNVTSVITEESDLHRRDHCLPIPDQVVSAVVENVMILRQVVLRARLHRLISIPKVREGAHDASSREFTIAAGGIEVASSVAGAERARAGAATQGAQPPVKRPRRRKGRTR